MHSVLLVDFALKHNALILREYTNAFALGCVQKLKEADLGGEVNHTRPSQLLGKSTVSWVAVQPSHTHALHGYHLLVLQI